MSIPANVRVNIGSPFPAQVKGNPQGLIAVQKANGIWTVSLNYGAYAPVAVIADPANTVVLIYNRVTGVYQITTMAAVLAPGISNPTIIAFANSPYAVKPTDLVIYVNTSGGPIELDLGAAAPRGGMPLVIKDITGNANANNVTVKPVVGETIDAYTNAAPLKINADFGGFRLNPYTLSYVISP